ncbi:uncharacterized protein LOC110036414 [Phalaenopsis equestris]|uniref:uncharacterized protein LOC110036414 n=1 Tax=Phalaenopsis equestris TaxID=78828 RepID=UPI0009E5B839|nr:uncharacterized protein LOC110036414 [Phalaenopsis equestris]
MLDLQKRRIQFALFIVGLTALSMTAEKFREIIGEQSSSKSGKFTFLNCFDLGSGTLACGVKESIKLYSYSIRSVHVENVRQRATDFALNEALQEGLSTNAAAKQAKKAGAKAAKLASRQARRIVGPIISSGWDFFEAIYYGGTMTEGFLRGSGTLFGTYIGGFHGEQLLGRLGYFAGSHLGSWVGGRVGLMFYDIFNGINYMFNFFEMEDLGKQVNNEGVSESTENSVGWGFF